MCIFCKIVDNEIPSYKIYEDELFVAFLDISQTTKGHTLVIPKQHFESMGDIEPSLAGKLFSLSVKLANNITKALDVRDYNIVINKGELAGQTVHHFHLHIIPRYTKDDFTLGFKQHELTKDDFLKLQELIKSKNLA